MSVITPGRYGPEVIAPSGKGYPLAYNDRAPDHIAAIDYWLAEINRRPDRAQMRGDVDALLEARTELTAEGTP